MTDDEISHRADQPADLPDVGNLPPDAGIESGEQHDTSPGQEPPKGKIDLAGIEADLDGVQAALARLADGSYWTDEVTGAPIAAETLSADPLARRA